ncbi:MAG: pyruvate carboxyltransferase [Thaumarchaeota archaeon]|nr:pyruvate carboxyltransferase [Nitrososphaerota archaeon]
MTSSFRKGGYYVSAYNFEDEVRAGLGFPKKVRIHDVTLRDGEQQAGVVFRSREKVRIARALAEAGVNRIEAGLPSVSSDDAKAVKEITHLGLQSKIFAFSRCMKSDVDNALRVDVDGLVMEIPSSDHLIKYGYGWTEDKAIDLAVEATDYAHRHGLYVAFFTIDSTRADFKVFWRLISQVATKGHMDSLVVADTFGVMNPQAYAHFVKRIRKVTQKPIEIHAHNDFGLGVANTLAGLAAGAEVAHVTVNGLGERSGNASLEELAVALKMLYGVKTDMKLDKLRSLSKLVERLSRVRLTPQKPVVGDRLFETESGIIAGWWRRLEKLGMPLEMFPFLPSVVGHDPVRIAVGKKSGRDSIFYRADKLGLTVDEAKVDKVLLAVKDEAIRRKRTLTDQEFSRITSRMNR